jgi:3-methylfumaryl-CoA hydratase
MTEVGETTVPRELIDDDLRSWIGRSESLGPVEITRGEIVKYALATEQRSETFQRGDEAPLLFLFGALRRPVPLDGLGPDGLAPDPLLPRLPLERVMAGGSKITRHRSVRPGDVLVGTRTLTDLYEKRGASGPLIFVVYQLEVTTDSGEPVMSETQTRIAR